MGWELIGGDPAPGSPDSIGNACAALAHIADIATQARQDLVKQTGAAGIEYWKGSAADAFRADVAKLPGDLDTLGTSYRDASHALSTFRDVLHNAQADAGTALRIATQAKADRDAAVARHDNARSEVAALTASHLKAQGSLAALQTQQKLSIDPAQRTSLNTPITSTRSQVNRLAGDLNAAKQAASRYQAQIDDADRRLRDAHQRADAVRRTLTAAADSAVSGLKNAERDAHLPSWWDQHLQDAEEWAKKHGPAVANILSIVETVLSVAALVFPVAAPFLLAGALLCGTAILLIDVLADAGTPGGFDREHLLHLGIDAASVFATAMGLGAAKGALAGASAAAKFANVGKWAGRAEQGMTVAEGYEQNGVTGAVTAFGTVVVGNKLSSKIGGKALQARLAKANANPATQSRINGMSQAVRAGADGTRQLSIPLDDVPSTRAAQSVLGSGRIPPGGFLPGNQAASLTGGSPADHAPSARVTDKYAEQMVAPVSKNVSGKLNEGAQNLLNALGAPTNPQPDIDIDLNPSPYGSTP
jgi:hypothetical protein